jgi:hypothetical protein
MSVLHLVEEFQDHRLMEPQTTGVKMVVLRVRELREKYRIPIRFTAVEQV